MGFSRDAYRRAFQIKKAAKYNAEQAYEREMARVREQNPELLAVERKLQFLSAQVGIAAMSGNREKAEQLRAEIEALRAKNADMLSIIDGAGVQYSCKKCEDTGYFEGRRCSCVEEIAKGLTQRELCSEMPLDDCRFDNFSLTYYSEKGSPSPRKRMTGVLKACREFSLKGGENQNLLLLGGTGLGKTHLSLAIANEFLENGHSVIYGSAQNIINKLANEQFSYKGDTSVSDSMLGCDLLIIDDLGAEMSTSFSQSCVYNIINTRLLKNLPTVISTNLSLEEIEKVYTPRVLSRIIGGYTLLQCLGEDIRQQKAGK